MNPIDDENELLNTIGDALEDISAAYVRDEDGNLLQTTVITSPSGEVIAKWERGTKTPAEIDALVRQFVEMHDLPEPPSQALTVGKVAARLGVSRRTVYGWCEAGRFPGAWRTLGSEARRGNWRIPANEVDEVKRMPGS